MLIAVWRSMLEILKSNNACESSCYQKGGSYLAFLRGGIDMSGLAALGKSLLHLGSIWIGGGLLLTAVVIGAVLKKAKLKNTSSG